MKTYDEVILLKKEYYDYYANKFDEEVTIQSNKDCTAFLQGCLNFNSPVKLDDSISNCDELLSGCVSFNIPIKLPPNAKCNYAFAGCASMRCNVICTENQFKQSDLATLGYTWSNGTAKCTNPNTCYDETSYF